MTHLPPSIKLKVFIATCAAWVLAGAWLVGCVALEAPLRMGTAAALSVVLIGIAVGFVKQDIDVDRARIPAGKPGGEAAMDGNGWD